jgi:hypothetical protein
MTSPDRSYVVQYKFSAAAQVNMYTSSLLYVICNHSSNYIPKSRGFIFECTVTVTIVFVKIL